MFSRFARRVAAVAGSPPVFALSVLFIVVWASCGPYFRYSDSWSLAVNTGTTIVTFWLGFIILNTQNRDGAAIQAKLDNLIKTADKANNDLIRLEEKTEEEIETLRSTPDAHN